VPLGPTPEVRNAFIGNDDHPSYSDQQISEAFAAKAISAIANSPYWSQSAIIITYDETDGYYDHVSPQFRNKFADGSVLAAGPRIPTILISPYAAAGNISHRYSEHGSVINKGRGPVRRPFVSATRSTASSSPLSPVSYAVACRPKPITFASPSRVR
jgi:phospholipase C